MKVKVPPNLKITTIKNKLIIIDITMENIIYLNSELLKKLINSDLKRFLSLIRQSIQSKSLRKNHYKLKLETQGPNLHTVNQ